MLAIVVVTGAFAGEPATVYHAGDPASAVVAAERGTGRPPWEIVPKLLVDTASPDRVAAFGGGEPPVCATTSTAASVRAQLAMAETAVRAGSWSEARPLLRETLLAIECLSEPAEATVSGRAALLLGVADAAAGEASASSFVRALAFQPALVWEGGFPTAGKAAFDVAAAGLATAPTGRIVLGPGGEASTLWVDGRPVAVQGGALVVSAGRHVVQFVQGEVLTLAVDVAPDGVVALISPPRVPPGAVAGAADPAVGAWLERFLAGRDAGPAYVWTGTDLLDLQHDFQSVPLRARTVQTTRSSPVPGALVISGVGLVGLGAVATAIGGSTYLANADGVPGESDDAYARRIIAAGAGSGMAAMGLTACGIGTVAIGVGIPLGLHGRRR
jgi:hypothetical protein